MDPTIATVLGAILGALLTGPVTYCFTKKLARIQRYDYAASKFRAGIIYELTGFFPIDIHWEENDFPRIYQSLPQIKSICSEFRVFVKSKDDFDAAVKAYDKYCRNTKYEELVPAWERFPNTYPKKPEDISPKDRFGRLVDHLLSFANDN